MKFNTKKAVAASVLFAIAGGAQADLISGFDAPNPGGADGELFISIFREDPLLAPESMMIDTNLSLFDLRSGATTSWISDAATTAAVLAFLGTSDISNFVFNAGGVTMANFDDQLNNPATYNPDEGYFVTTNTANSTAALLTATTADGLYTPRTNMNAFIAAFNQGYDTDVATGINAGELAYHDNIFLWNDDVGGILPTINTEGDIGTALALWNVYNGSDEFFVTIGEVALIGFLNIDATTGAISFSEGVSEVPVPAAAWLLGSGLVGLVGVARRRVA